MASIEHDPRCGRCRYIVRGLEGRTCPECGADLDVVGVVTGPPGWRRLPGRVGLIVTWTLVMLVLSPWLSYRLHQLSPAPLAINDHARFESAWPDRTFGRMDVRSLSIAPTHDAVRDVETLAARWTLGDGRAVTFDFAGDVATFTTPQGQMTASGPFDKATFALWMAANWAAVGPETCAQNASFIAWKMGWTSPHISVASIDLNMPSGGWGARTQPTSWGRVSRFAPFAIWAIGAITIWRLRRELR